MIPDRYAAWSTGFSSGFGEPWFTELGPSATPRIVYGSFAGKEEQAPEVDEESLGNLGWAPPQPAPQRKSPKQREYEEELRTREQALQQAQEALEQEKAKKPVRAKGKVTPIQPTPEEKRATTNAIRRARYQVDKLQRLVNAYRIEMEIALLEDHLTQQALIETRRLQDEEEEFMLLLLLEAG